ncbi:hypothetical protein [Saccharomonospora xinjiangensis]|nr:hypothetical protein [Saccharomonospora xinjiangensis]
MADHVGRWRTPLHLKTWYAVTDDPVNRADIPRQPARRFHSSPQPSD